MRTSESKPRKRALLIVGAGASVELGVPATDGFGREIELAVRSDRGCQESGGTAAYSRVKEVLEGYYGAVGEAHFERIYHVLHELRQYRVTPRAVPKFKPVMRPFVDLKEEFSDESLRTVCRVIIETIYKLVSKSCDNPKCSLTPMTEFLDFIEEQYIPRIYTTNYDDFLWQATKGRYSTGYRDGSSAFKVFDSAGFWSSWDAPGLFYMHGSVHMGFCPPGGNHREGLVWYDDRNSSLNNAFFDGSGINRMDGTNIDRGSIITGLDKLSRLQQSPFGFYYAGYTKDILEADAIFVLGSGLADLHLNSFMSLARTAKPDVPIFYVGYWGSEEEFYSAVQFDLHERDICLIHELAIDITNIRERDVAACLGWTLGADKKSAVWSGGFQSFLANHTSLTHILSVLTQTSPVSRTPEALDIDFDD